METVGATNAMASRRHRHKKLRWEYTGVLTKQPSKTALKRSTHPKPDAAPKAHAPAPLDPPLAESFLSDASMATSHSQTTAASSNDPQTPTTPLGILKTSHHHNTIPAPPPPPATATNRLAIDSDALARMGRVAKKRVESLAQRDALVGRWRKRKLGIAERLAASGASPAGETSSKPLSGRRRRQRAADSARVECQVLDFKSQSRDEYKILARMNIAGSLREIMSVLATDNAAHFHRSMAALFGSQYLTGENVVTNESVGLRRTRSTSARLSKALLLASRRQSSMMGIMWPMSVSALSHSTRSSAGGFSNIKMALNSVTLQLRHGLFRRQLHDWQFLDYLDENVDAMAVTRVLQTVPSGPKKSRPSQPQRRSVGDVLAGYVIREDREAQFTRVFFYGEARCSAGAGKVAKHTKKLLRAMVETLCRLVATVERQRLSALYREHRSSESVPVAASRCFACNASFGLSSRRHTCACCRQSVCRKCLEQREIETGGDADASAGTAATKALAIGPPVVQRVRVCRGCVDRVSLPSLVAARRDDTPRLDEDEEEDEDEHEDDVIVVDAFSDSGSYDWE